MNPKLKAPGLEGGALCVPKTSHREVDLGTPATSATLGSQNPFPFVKEPTLGADFHGRK